MPTRFYVHAPAHWLLGALLLAGAGAPAFGQDAAPQSSWRQTMAQAEVTFTLWCGPAALEVTPAGQALDLRFQGQRERVEPAISASGARYVNAQSPETEYWNKGEQAMLTWQGVVWPTCAPAGAIVSPFQASGNEPFWSVEYDGWTLTLKEPGAQSPALPAEVSERSPTRTVVTAGEGASRLVLEVNDQLCQDTMSGMPHPQTARLSRNNQVLQGCGGDPGRLFQGVTWQIDTIDGKPLAAAATPTVTFGTDGLVSGLASCNRYTGSYALTGEGLRTSQLATTRMACPRPLEAQEQAVLGHLQNLQGFEMSERGQLTLRSERGTLGARVATGS